MQRRWLPAAEFLPSGLRARKYESAIHPGAVQSYSQPCDNECSTSQADEARNQEYGYGGSVRAQESSGIKRNTGGSACDDRRIQPG